MFSCLQILEAFLWFVLIDLLHVTLIILTLIVSSLLNLLLRLVAFLLFINPPCFASFTLSLHDALPIYLAARVEVDSLRPVDVRVAEEGVLPPAERVVRDRKSTRLNSSHVAISYAVFCLKKKI